MAKRKTHEEFVKEVYDLVGEEYSVLSDYINSYTYVQIIHNECGHKWNAPPNRFLRGHRCPKCANRIPYTKEMLNNKLKELVNDEYSIIGDFINYKTKIKIIHNKCGNIFEMVPNNFVNHNQRCPKCFGTFKKTTEQFKREVYNLVGNQYEVLNEYENNQTKILMKHNICNYKYYVTPNNFLKGNRCPVCAESKGEQKIRNWLEQNNIKFKPQYTFNDLLSDKGNLLRFDFGILNNNKLKCLIEYDGVGHYNESVFGEYSYNYTIEYDNLKNIYCQRNNISLLRIPYWNYNNLENIIIDYLTSLGVYNG